jgi:hypothetical protein
MLATWLIGVIISYALFTLTFRVIIGRDENNGYALQLWDSMIIFRSDRNPEYRKKLSNIYKIVAIILCLIPCISIFIAVLFCIVMLIIKIVTSNGSVKLF